MKILADIAILIIWIGTVSIRSLPLEKFYISDFELGRLRRDRGESISQTVAENLPLLRTLLDLAFIVYFFAIVLLLAWQHIAWQSFLIAVILLVLSILVSKIGFVIELNEKLFWWKAPAGLKIIRYLKPLLKILETKSSDRTDFSSKEELIDMIRRSDYLNSGEISRAIHILRASETKVAAVMIKRSKIISVKDSDLLGPKLVDQLYASGHRQFPVYSGSIDSPVGTLYLDDIVGINTLAKNLKVSEALKPEVAFLGVDDSLSDALKLVVSSHQTQFLVVDDKKKVKGLIGLSDILKNALGEFGNEAPGSE